MAHILMATNPIAGHANPALPIASKLVERGHEVWWYSGRGFKAKIEATGAHFVSVKDPSRDWSIIEPADWIKENKPELANLEGIPLIKAGMKYGFIDPAAGYFRDLMQVLKEFPADVLLSDTLFVAAQFLHEKTGLPYTSFGESALAINSRDTAPFGPALPPDASFKGRLRNHAMNFLISRVVMREVNRHYEKTRASLGLSRQGRPFFETLISPYLVMQGTVPSFEYPRSDLPPQVHFVGPFLPQVKDWTPPAWWPEVRDSTRPVIQVTQGTINTNSADLIVPAIYALAGEDVLVVATTGVEDKLPIEQLPSNVRVAPFIPYSELLPLVDIMITNGGYGGVQNALAHGVPLIVAGTTEDKAEVSARVAWSGAGLNLKTKTPSVDQIWTAVQRLQKEPSFRQKAQLIAAEMGQHDGPLEAAILLEELISTRRPILTGAPLNQELPPTVNPEKMTTSSGMFQREGHFYWYL